MPSITHGGWSQHVRNRLVRRVASVADASACSISLIALLALYVGLTFGFNLWNPATPLVTMVWLAVVSSPAWFYGLLIWSNGQAAEACSYVQ